MNREASPLSHELFLAKMTKRCLLLDWRDLSLHETTLPDRNTEMFNNMQTYLETGKGGGWESKDNMAPHKLLAVREHGASSVKMMK